MEQVTSKHSPGQAASPNRSRLDATPCIRPNSLDRPSQDPSRPNPTGRPKRQRSQRPNLRRRQRRDPSPNHLRANPNLRRASHPSRHPANRLQQNHHGIPHRRILLAQKLQQA
jgi:hypothetical protein